MSDLEGTLEFKRLKKLLAGLSPESREKFERMMTEKTKDKEVYTPEEFGSRLGVPVTTVREWLRKGHLKGRKIGRLWFIPHAELEATLNPESE